MNLILWRHAEADDGSNDMKRELTRRGLKQAAAMADWLRIRVPEDAALLASRATRSQQTAASLSSHFAVVKSLDPDRGVEDLIAAVDWPHGGAESRTVIAVGHQPTLGRVAALLLGGHEDDWAIRKGAVWWFSNRTRGEETRTILRAAILPELL
ncbi:MAG: SixA phosphatase family protein [Burkholderiales bacterium]